MKNVLFLLLGIVAVMWSCSKENEIKPEMKPENIYQMEDSDTDSIQHRRYEIYQNYGVSVFFNDTVGKVFVKVDVKGDSVFQYERLDPAWSYMGYNNLDYQYTYMRKPEEQSKYLNMIEAFLKQCSNTLYPYSIFVVNNYRTVDLSGNITSYSNGSYSVFYKLLLITGTGSTNISEMPTDLVRSIIASRITDYKDLLSAFTRISKEYVGKKDWETLGIGKLTIPVEYENEPRPGIVVTEVVDYFYIFPLYSSTKCLQDDWSYATRFPAEVVEKFKLSVRTEIGRYGFVGQSVKSTQLSIPPKDADDDLNTFVKEVMRYSREDFKKAWGAFPLVMQKYEILADIIENQLGVKL